MSTTPNPLNQFFIEMEHKWLNHWYEQGIVEEYLHKNDSSEKRFSFQDGPITANNPMGVHHAWGRTYKDLWQKFHNLLGYRQRFQNGFDCQGLWVEVEVEKELELRSKKDIENLVPGDSKASIAKFVQLCKDRVHKFAGIQTEQSKRLGYFMDWERSYFTMSEDNNYMIWHFLKTCHERGWIYKGKDSVPWCPRCETAISQHEMLTEDYKDVTHESVYFKLKLTQDISAKLPSASHNLPIYLVAWTTTPWTIPGNVALGVNTDLYYVIIKQKDCLLIVAEDRISILGDNVEIVKRWLGQDLIGLKYEAPFDFLPRSKNACQENPDTFHTVINGSEVVTNIEGTGILHVAPGQGKEDFDLGKKYHLSIIELIDDSAHYFEGMGQFSGKNAKKHPELIIDFLKEEAPDHLYKIEKYRHRYPACWRCKAELVWKVADEWYISMDLPSQKDPSDKRTLRERMMDVTKKITWMPSFGLDRELDWLSNMHDWLISKKNRYWGLALPIYECKECKRFEIIGSKDELKERAVEGWEEFEGKSPHKPYIDAVKIACPTCKKTIERIGDVGNPWLDAGIVPYSTMKNGNTGEPLYLSDKEEWRKWFPANFITESFPGQFKNWFYAMIAMSTVLEDTNPYQRVLGFATLTGEDGRPMHKSWGNSVAFHEGADIMGVDVMRWMYVRHNPAENLPFGYKKADEVRRQFYITVWNTYKYYRQYADHHKITYQFGPIKQEEFTHVLDRWILCRLKETIEGVHNSLLAYDARQATGFAESLVHDFSTWYIRRSRDRANLKEVMGEDESRYYEVIAHVLAHLSIVISPFLPFITEEIFTQLTREKSVHLSNWPDMSTLELDQKLITDMALVRSICEVGHRVRKELKIKVRQPLASVVISLPATITMESSYQSDLEQILRDELNVKSLIWNKSKSEEIEITYDTEITPELKREGDVRELIRQIQQERKKLGVQPGMMIELTLLEQFKPDENEIASHVYATKIIYGDSIQVRLL